MRVILVLVPSVLLVLVFHITATVLVGFSSGGMASVATLISTVRNGFGSPVLLGLVHVSPGYLLTLPKPPATPN